MSIAILTVGGTIDKDYFDALSEYQITESPIHELLHTFNVNFEYNVIPVMKKDSLDMTNEDRDNLKSLINQLDQQQVLITHGTDTMAQTAKVLADIENKTIILTGAMKPARFKDTDAIFNIGFALGALRVLTEGVYIAMNGEVFKPENVIKNRAEHRFETIHQPI